MDIKKLSQMSSVKSFEKDEIIINEGDPGEEMFIVLSGKVDVFINSVDGYPLSVSVLSSGDFFGEMSLLEGLSRSASVQTLEPTLVLAINKENFEELIIAEPSLALRMLKGLSSRLRRQNEGVRKSKNIRGELSAEINTTSEVNSWLVPTRHKTYRVPVPASHEQYLFERKVKCPICGQLFDAQGIQASKLNAPHKVEIDLRQCYGDFEPLWYLIWACPHCLYANFSSQFHKVSVSQRRLILEGRNDSTKKDSISLTTRRDLDQAFTAYYLALRGYASDRDYFSSGKLWLHLSWLYQDVEDKEMYSLASARALQYYKLAMNNIHNISKEEKIRLFQLIGELFLRNGNRKEALKHFKISTKLQYGINYLANYKKEQERILGEEI